MIIDLLNQYSPAKDSDQTQAELTNMYLEQDSSLPSLNSAFNGQPRAEGEYKKIARSMPGLSLFCDTGLSNVRYLYEHFGITYCVAGNQFGSISSNGIFTQIGSNLSTSSGYAKIVGITGATKNSNTQLTLIDGTNGYTYNVGTSTAQFPISDTDFPQTASDISAQDDFVIVVDGVNQSGWSPSKTGDSTSWDPLEFALFYRQADDLLAIKAFRGELWLFGSNHIEVWVDTGNSTFTFERLSYQAINEGLTSKQAVVIAANSLIYLSQSRSGGYKVVTINGYQPKRLSNPDIESAINALTTQSDCIAYAYAIDGHEFVDFVFPTDAKTFTVDLSTGIWSKKESLINSSYTRFLGNTSCFCYGKCLIGDYNSGKVYYLDRNTYTENGNNIRKRFTSPPVYAGGKRIFINRLQIDVQTNVGSNKTFLLEMTTDRGVTWETVEIFTVPTDPSQQLYTLSLGSAFCFMFRLTTTDQFPFTILGFQADASVGAN